MINETAVRCFLTLCDTLSFTETAKRMYMTQQSVSKYIAKLEEDLGYRLFIRTHHYVALTRAGEIFRRTFALSASAFTAAMEEARRYYDELPNALHIGYLEGLEISSRIGDALRRLKADRPELQFSGEKRSQAELNDMLRTGQMDLIITYKEFAPQIPGIRRAKVLDTPLVLLVSPDNPLATDSATYLDFARSPFIKAAVPGEPLSQSKQRALKQCQGLGFSPSDILIQPNLESAYMAAELGQGVFVSTMLSRVSRQSNLKIYPIGQTEELLCLWQEDQENPAVGDFVAHLAAQ